MNSYNIRLFIFTFDVVEWTNTHITTVIFKYLAHFPLSPLSVHPPTTPFPLPPLVEVNCVCR